MKLNLDVPNLFTQPLPAQFNRLVTNAFVVERYYFYSKFRNTRHRTKHFKKRCLKTSFEWIVCYKRQKCFDCLIAFKEKKIPFILAVDLKLNTVKISKLEHKRINVRHVCSLSDVNHL